MKNNESNSELTEDPLLAIDDFKSLMERYDRSYVRRDAHSHSWYPPKILEAIGKLPEQEKYSVLNMQGIGNGLSYPPLYYALKWVNPTIIKGLLDAGADPNVLFVNRLMPLQSALTLTDKENCRAQILDMLLQAGANTNSPFQNGKTPLIYAIDK